MTAALDWVSTMVEERRLPSAVFGAATSRGIELLEAFGDTAGRTARVDDHYALFSVTKPLVGLVTMRQVEAGRLSLRTPLRSAVPSFGPGRTDDVTLAHLLSHTSGILETSLTPADLVAALATAPALFEAGTLTHYCNLAFAGVGELVRSATGRSIADLVDEHLNAVIGDGAITFDPACDPVPVPGVEHGLDFDAFVALRHPAGALFARAADLLSLGSALLRGDPGVITPVTLDAMRRPYTAGLTKLAPDPVNAGQDFGLTWNLRHSAPALLERRLYGHGGWSGCQWWMYPEHDACFVLLTNVLDPHRFGADIDNLHNAFVTDVVRGAVPAA